MPNRLYFSCRSMQMCRETWRDVCMQWFTGWWFGCHQFYFPRNIGNVIIPIDELIFFRGVAEPPTRIWFIGHSSIPISVFLGLRTTTHGVGRQFWSWCDLPALCLSCFLAWFVFIWSVLSDVVFCRILWNMGWWSPVPEMPHRSCSVQGMLKRGCHLARKGPCSDC